MSSVEGVNLTVERDEAREQAIAAVQASQGRYDVAKLTAARADIAHYDAEVAYADVLPALRIEGRAAVIAALTVEGAKLPTVDVIKDHLDEWLASNQIASTAAGRCQETKRQKIMAEAQLSIAREQLLTARTLALI